MDLVIKVGGRKEPQELPILVFLGNVQVLLDRRRHMFSVDVPSARVCPLAAQSAGAQNSVTVQITCFLFYLIRST